MSIPFNEKLRAASVSAEAKAEASFKAVVGGGQRTLAWLAMRMILERPTTADFDFANPLYGHALIDNALLRSYRVQWNARQKSRTSTNVNSVSLDTLIHREDHGTKSDVDTLLDEVLSELWKRGEFNSVIERALASVCEPLDLLPASSAARYRLWARGVIGTNVKRRSALGIVQFVRSVLAAHVLGVVELTIESADRSECEAQSYVARIRFRHRRLAEYYAALHLVEDANVVTATLRFQPMLSPVLNIACALGGEGGEKVLRWFTAQLSTTSGAEGRFLREALAEALAFAMGGAAFNTAASALVEDSVRSLRLPGQLVKLLGVEGVAAKEVNDLVSVASSMRMLGRLGPVLAEVGSDAALSKDLRLWWDVYAEFGDAPDPVDRQRAAESLRATEKRPTARLLDMALIAIEHPSEVLFRHEHFDENRCPAWARKLAWAVYGASELVRGAFAFCATLTGAIVIGALAHLAGGSQLGITAGVTIMVIGLVGWMANRVHRFRMDPQTAVRASCHIDEMNKVLRWVRLWRVGRRPSTRAAVVAFARGCVFLSGLLLLSLTVELIAIAVYYVLSIGVNHAWFGVAARGTVLLLLAALAIVSLGYAVLAGRSLVRARRARYHERVVLDRWNEQRERSIDPDELRKELLAIIADDRLTLRGRDQGLSLLYANADSLVANTSAANEVAEAAHKLAAEHAGNDPGAVIARRLAKAADHLSLRLWHRSG